MYIRKDIVSKERQPKEDSPVLDDDGHLRAFRRAEDWERLAILEVRVQDHEEEIKQLIVHQQKLADTLDSISRTLVQIKYVVLGALGMVVVTKIGFFETLLLMLKGGM